MATATIRSTYALDVETVRALERMARRWKVSKSEALRRAIKAAAGQPGEGHQELEVLTRLQQSVGLSEQRARSWAREAREERRAASSRAGSRP